MSASSTSNITPPIPCQGVEFGYTTPLPTLNPNSLGFTYRTNVPAPPAVFPIVIPVNPAGSNTIIQIIEDVPAGTYIATCIVQASFVTSDAAIAIGVIPANSPSPPYIANSLDSFFVAPITDFQSQSNSLVFTTTVLSDVVVFADLDGTGAVTINVSNLQLVRIA